MTRKYTPEQLCRYEELMADIARQRELSKDFPRPIGADYLSADHGICPLCNQRDIVLEGWRSWGICRTHRLKWRAGYGSSLVGQIMGDDEIKQAQTMLEECREIEFLFTPSESRTDPTGRPLL